MYPFPAVQGIKRFEVTEPTEDNYREGGNQVRIEFTVKANEKLRKLIKQFTPRTAGYTDYFKLWPNSLVVIVSCRGYEVTAEGLLAAATDFGKSLLESIQAEINRRAEEAATRAPEEAETASEPDSAPVYRNDRRLAKRS